MVSILYSNKDLPYLNMLTRNLLTVYFTLWMPTAVVGTHYPEKYYLDKQCGWQLVFPESLLLKYSDRGYTSIPPNYNCLMTIAGSSPGRGLQVRFRKLETADTVDCSQVRLTVSNRTGPLTPTNGVCGFTSPQTVRTTDDSVDVRFATDNTTSQSGYFELLLTEFTYAINGNCIDNDFKCNNSICISANLKCNGYNDCDDNSDEIEGCGETFAPGIIVVIVYASIAFIIVIGWLGVVYHRRRRYIPISG
ncbi:membrane frizzled-related protein-like [Pomacea canaliculata]|uniref:membrane frizzled-related protein-like n=1 Tax=Pomacea canaliculata TaxID=400727 RepID=UPI000D72F6FB|nr:membrane frizzled-related protein-like [Pomacea canaliculata]